LGGVPEPFGRLPKRSVVLASKDASGSAMSAAEKFSVNTRRR
jgi:hypothetical protein